METKWILKLIDQISNPLRAIQGAADEVADAVKHASSMSEDMADAVRDIYDPIRAATSAAVGLSESLTGASGEAHKLQRNIDSIKDTLEGYKAKLTVETDPQKIRTYETMIGELQHKLNELEHSPNPAESGRNWGSFVTAANQAYEITEKIAESMDFAGEFNNMRKNIQRMTGFTGKRLSDISQHVTHLADVFNEEGEDIARAANVLTNQIGGTFEENLALIQAGYEKGANINKDMLDQLMEYPAKIKESGLSASQALALMTQAGQKGVFSDKALDGIKEAEQSLREMGQPQIDALHAIGLKVKDVAGKTSWEAIQMVSKAMSTASVQAKQMALADIFKGAGEDSGLGWIEGLSSVNLDVNKIPSVQQAGESTKGFLADMKSWFADTFGGIAQEVSIMGSIGATIAGLTPIFTAARTAIMGTAFATNIAAAAQWAWNAAFVASPIGWIVTAIAAVTAAVIYAWNNFEGFRSGVFGLWESFKTVFNNIAGLFKAVFAPIGEAIAAIQDGRYRDAAKAAIKLNPVNMTISAGQYIANGGLTKGVGDAWDKGKAKGAAAFNADQETSGKEKTSYTNGLEKDKKNTVTLDGKLFNQKTGTMTGKADSGLNFAGSGTGGGKAITMTLNITNNFHQVNNKLDIRKVADDVVGHINDKLRDALITTG